MGNHGRDGRAPCRNRPHHAARPLATRVNLEFAITSWAACGPGLATPAQWQAWAAAPYLPAGDAAPELPEVPAMTRRRLNTLGRNTLRVAFDAHGDTLGLPVVLGSRYGDSLRSLDLLADMVRGDPVSPTAFGLSVHNAIGALYAIVRGDHANYISVAAGPGTAAAALVEAAALLADGAPEVLVVECDAPLPGDYAGFDDEPAALYAWAWRVRRPVAGDTRFTLAARPSRGEPPAPGTLPFGLDALRFMLSGDAAWQRTAGATCWDWRRHDA